MAFFGLFGKKKEKEPELDAYAELGLEQGRPDEFSVDNGLNNNLEIEHPQEIMQQRIQMPQQHSLPPNLNKESGLDKRDIDLILNKLDLINSRLETLSERIASLERYNNTEQRKRW